MADKKELNKLLREFEKDYNIKRASDIVQGEVMRTGLYPLDYVLDGGISQVDGGHRIEFYGAESSGKSTFSLYVIKKYQEEGKTCVLIDAENSYDKAWGELIGVNNEELIIINPNSLEEAGDLFVKLIPKVDLLVIDSIVSMIPETEIERATNEQTMALGARVNALICRKILGVIGKYKTTMIFINQLREKVGVMYGSPFTTGGGRALKHLYNTRIEFRAGKPIEVGSGDKKERIGLEINLNCVKNKRGKPSRKAVIDFYFNGNIDNTKSLFFSAVKYDIISRSGSYYEYNGIKECGKDNLIAKLTKEDWDIIQEEIWKRIK